MNDRLGAVTPLASRRCSTLADKSLTGSNLALAALALLGASTASDQLYKRLWRYGSSGIRHRTGAAFSFLRQGPAASSTISGNEVLFRSPEGMIRSSSVSKGCLTELIELSEQNSIHFPVRQLLALVSNILLGHPDAPDGLMSCTEVPQILADGTKDRASVYRNVFGENLKPRRAEKLELFRKLGAFGIGGETSNRVDTMLVYGADDPALMAHYQTLVLNDPVYGGTVAYAQAQRAYLEGQDTSSQESFLPLLRAQRQRLFFTLPASHEVGFDLWDLTVFRHGGLFLELVRSLEAGRSLPRRVMLLVMRGLNRVFTGMLVQNQDELVLATSGSHAQSKASPLLDALISVPRQGGEEVSLSRTTRGGPALAVRLSRGDDPGVIELPLTPTRFEFLGQVAEGALPSSFSLECHEDLLAFKARLLSATRRRRLLNDDDAASPDELVLHFIELGADGRALPRRVTVRM